VRLEGLGKLKNNSFISLSLEPATFRLVSYCLNHYYYYFHFQHNMAWRQCNYTYCFKERDFLQERKFICSGYCKFKIRCTHVIHSISRSARQVMYLANKSLKWNSANTSVDSLKEASEKCCLAVRSMCSGWRHFHCSFFPAYQRHWSHDDNENVAFIHFYVNYCNTFWRSQKKTACVWVQKPRERWMKSSSQTTAVPQTTLQTFLYRFACKGTIRKEIKCNYYYLYAEGAALLQNNRNNGLKRNKLFRFANKLGALVISCALLWTGPLLWSSGVSSWLQIQMSGFDSRHY
jgi:hypothetical protein